MIQSGSLPEADSAVYLNSQPIAAMFDRIYFDPMYLDDAYAAQVKKEAQLLRALVGADTTGDQALFQAALRSGCERIVVKRPRLAPTFSSAQIPQYVITGKTVRFDVYIA